MGGQAPRGTLSWANVAEAEQGRPLSQVEAVESWRQLLCILRLVEVCKRTPLTANTQNPQSLSEKKNQSLS